MASREELQSTLEKLLGSKNVYYQPPSTMSYPAIKYSKDKIQSTFANNKSYLRGTRYSITVIDRRPDNPVIDKLLDLRACSYDRQYISDNLYHDVLTLYY